MKTITVIVLMLLSISILGQTKIDSIVSDGIRLHDKGNYLEAIEVYKRALAIEPESPLVNYEIGMSYLYAKNYEKALEHSNLTLASDNKYYLPAVILKGSSLDYLGRTDESIELFKKALKLHPDAYLLHYNLGYNYYRLKKFKDATESFQNVIKYNPSHVTSRIFLALIMHEAKKKTQCVLSAYFALLLEPNSERAKYTVYPMLMKNLSGNLKRDENKPNDITIMLGKPDKDDEFSAAELMIGMLEASKSLEENKDRTEIEHFIETTSSFFKVLGELKKKKNKGLWWEFYVPFFYNLSKTEHLEAFCNYISSSGNEESRKWLKNNGEKVDKLFEWLEKNSAQI